MAKVRNPNPRLVNIALEGGGFIHIGPGDIVEIDDDVAARMVASGSLEAVDDEAQETPAERPAAKKSAAKKAKG